MTAPRSLYEFPPGMTALELHEALGLTEHSRRKLENAGLLIPVKIGSKRIYPRWQAFNMLGLVDPDQAAADAARESMTIDPGHSKASTGGVNAFDIHVLPTRATGEVPHAER